MRKREVSEEYVVAVKNDPEKAVESAGISIRNFSLAQYPNLQPYFPADAYEDFLSTITWVREVEPREHDAKCTAYVMRLREGRHSSDLFKCRYVFATNNPTFARNARNYCRQSHLIQDRQWGPVVHLVDLATVAWLRTGLQGDVIPRGRLFSALLLLCVLGIVGTTFAWIESIAHNLFVMAALGIVGLLSAYALWAAYMNLPIVFLENGLNRFGKWLLEARAEKRVSIGCIVEQLPLVHFSGGMARRTLNSS